VFARRSDPAAPVASSATSAPDPVLVPVLASFVVTCLLILSTVHAADPDLWGHVRYGQDALATGRLPATATHTYTAPAHPWINHENLSEIVFAALVNGLGPAGLTATTLALGLVVVLLFVVRAARAGVGVPVLVVTVLLAVCNITPGWALRPQLFTYAFFAILLVVLDGAFRRPERRWTLAVLPPLFAVWANAHGGFLAGLGVLVVWVAATTLQAAARRDGTAGRTLVGGGVVVVLAGVATLLNPYGPRLLTWLLADVAPPRPEIGEWGPMTLRDPVSVVFALLVAVAAFALARARRGRSWAEVAVLAVTAYEAVVHSRHVVFFGIAAGLFVPPYLDDAARRGRRAVPHPRPAGSPVAVRRLAAAAWLATAALVAVLISVSRTLWVGRAAYPVDAVQYLADRRIGDRIVADFDWAQYTLAALPASTVAFDGRLRTCYPQDVADAYFDFVLGNPPGKRWRGTTSPPFDDRRILELGNPDLVLLGRDAKHALKVMKRAASEWTLLYRDRVALVWGRRSVYDDPDGVRYVPPAARQLGRRGAEGWVPWPAFPDRRPS
jgi:hypothetical protein